VALSPGACGALTGRRGDSSLAGCAATVDARGREGNMRRAAGVALALVLVAALARVAVGGGSSSGADRPHAATAAATRAAADGGARVVAQRRVAANIVDLTVRSPALGETATVRLVTP